MGTEAVLSDLAVLSEVLLSALPARVTLDDFAGYAPPEHGEAAEYWADGYNEALDAVKALVMRADLAALISARKA